jgi:hypothetical protein
MQIYWAEGLRALREKVGIVFYSLAQRLVPSLASSYESQLLIQAKSSSLPPFLDLISGRKDGRFSFQIFPPHFRSYSQGLHPTYPVPPLGSFSDKIG